MGLTINKKLYSETHGVVDSIYCRLESVIYQRPNSRLTYTLQFYTSEEGLEGTYPKYFEDMAPSSSAMMPVKCYEIVSGSVSGSKILDVDDDGNELYGVEFELPLHHRMFLTSSEEITKNIYEEQDVYNTITYTDYDDEGNLVEKSREEYSGSEMVKVGEETSVKTYADHDLVKTSSIYEITYEKAKTDLEVFFGSGSVEDVV